MTLVGLDTSSLKPLTPSVGQVPIDSTSEAASKLDLSSLTPAEDWTAPASSAGSNARPDNLPLQVVAGGASYVPKAIGQAIDTVLPKQLGTSDDSPERAIAFNNFITQKYGPPDPSKPNGWDDETRAKAWQQFAAAGNVPTPPTANPSVGTMLQEGLSAAHLNPEDYFPAPQSAAERIARAAGEGSVAMLIPGAGELRAGKLIGDLATGALAGAGGQTASELAPDEYKPLANLVGAVATGGAGAIVTQGAKMAAKEAATAYAGLPETVLGLPTGSRTLAERAAANYVQNAAENPTALRNSLETMPADTGVPGFAPNLYQATDDSGIGVLSGVIDRSYPEAFVARRTAQTQAWHDALAGMEPEGQPAAAANVIRQQMDELDALTNAQQERAMAQVNDSLRPDVPATDAAQQVRNAMQSVSDARDERISDMYKALDPAGTMSVVSGPLKRASASVYDDLPAETQSSLLPYEREVQQTISDYGATLPLRNLMALKSRISQEMMAANSPINPNRAAAGRLSQLRGAVENAIDDTVSGQVASDQAAVTAGQMAPQDTLYARLLADRQNWLANRDAQGNVARADLGEGTIGNGAERPATIPGPSGAEGETTGGLSSAPSGPAISPEQPPHQLDAATAQQLRAATAATKELRTQQRAAPVSSILQREGATFPYKMSPGTAATTMWKSGPKGADAIRNIASLGQNHPDIAEGLSNLAENSLRSETAKSGLTPEALMAWRTKYGPALDELERVSPGTLDHFDTVQHATDALAEARRIREDSVASYEKSALGKFIGAHDDNEVVRHVDGLLQGKTAVRDMRALVREVQSDPDAISGLRRAVVDALSGRVMSATATTSAGSPVLSAAMFNRFLGRTEPALREVLEPEQLATLRAIGATMRQASKTVNIPGQSATHQFREAAARFKEQSPEQRGTIWGNLVGRLTPKVGAGLAGAGLGYLLSPSILTASLGAIGAELYAAMRQAGITHTNQIVREMIADPIFARDMLRKVPLQEKGAAWTPLINRLKTMAMISPVIASQNTVRNRQRNASGE